MIPRVGNTGSDIPVETQMLLLQAKEEPDFDALKEAAPYILFLPVLDGEFRSSLQGNSSNELEFCVESGNNSENLCSSIFLIFIFLLFFFFFLSLSFLLEFRIGLSILKEY